MSAMSFYGIPFWERMAMNRDPQTRQTELLSTMKAVEKAFQRAVREALIEHKRAGRAVADCTGGQVKWIPAEQIVIPAEPK